MKKQIRIMSVLLAVLLLAAPPAAQADSPGAVTGGIHFTAAQFGMEGWMRFEVHATGPGTAATGAVRWQEYNPAFGWRSVVAHAVGMSWGESGGADAAAIVLQIDSRSGWGEGSPGQYVQMWVRDGGSPGLDHDAFATLNWPPQDDPPGCTYADASFVFATIAEGNLTIHD
jgi:hypothetical protein